MKTKLFLIKTICILILSFGNLTFLIAQTPAGFCTVLHQPCDSDGVVVTTVTSGFTPPLNFKYICWGAAIYHYNVNVLSDTLSNMAFPFNTVYIYDNFGHTLYLSTGIVWPFYYDHPTVTKAICPNDTGSVLITINGGSMPASVQWYKYIDSFPGQYFTTGNPANLPVGSYNMIVTDSNGCVVSIDSGRVNITQTSSINFDLSTTPANCTNGTSTITNLSGGIEPYTYNWFNGATTSSIGNLTRGYYPVTVTDALGCSKGNYAYISQTPNIYINFSTTNASCLGNDGSCIAFASGGTPPYSYLYSNGFSGQELTGLSGGTTLGVYVTDVNGCLGSNSTGISISTPITVTYTTTPSSCSAPTGNATLNITGGTIPYTIEWNIFPPQSGITLSGVSVGQYSFKVTDAVGCIRTGSVYISQQNYISAYVSSTNSTCPDNSGSIYISVYGSNPPFTYNWSTGTTTPTIFDLSAGYYDCTITDNAGCSVVKGANIQMTSPLNIGIISTPASCLFINNGSIQALATGGTSPYTYHWSNGQTGQNATNLLPGAYNIYVHDANGCTQNKFVYLNYNLNNDSCYCKITGKVFVDPNNNCIYDTSETTVEHIMIHCSGMGYSFTNADGIYSFIVPSGSYTLSESVQSIYPLASCQNNSTNINISANPGCVSTINFANIINPIHDIHIIRTDINPAIPGYSYIQRLIIENEGTINEPNIQLGFKHDGQLQYNSTLPNIYNQLSPLLNPHWYSVNSAFPNLIPGESASFLSEYTVPTNIPLATLVNFTDTTAYTSPTTNWLADYTPWNNISNYQTTIVGSFDPNFVEVSPKGINTPGYIKNTDSVLTYVIHFQNTGSYYAQNIILIDTLDSDLNWLSLRPGYSDHNYTAEINETGIVKFTFKNIYLASKNYGDIVSCGLVTYSIKLKRNLSVGTQIKNRTAIFFDYNVPVMTNTTLNTISDGSDIKEQTIQQSMRIYPNPFNSKTSIEFSNPDYSEYTLTIIDITGKEVRIIHNIRNNKIEIEKDNLLNGFYAIELKGEKIFRGKIIIH